ncbi:MAG: class I SAM-dependent methyltransferase [Legionella sp.]|uniref:class I SAM-dependent methyltransferase n=1 Tax=Legionella sp. TaxID=459 RepID=UPI0039E583CE
MIKYKILWLLFFLIPTISYSNCPEINPRSHQTQNNMGKSSYLDPFYYGLFLHTIKKNLLDIKRPILIAGGGYGAELSELFQLGANTIYFNDLDSHNIKCAKNFVDKNLPKKKNKVRFLLGNISNESVFSSISDSSLGMVYAKNVIPFLSAIQLQQFIKNSNQKLYPNGLLLFIFENPVLVQQIEMVHQIKEDDKSSNAIQSKITLDNATKKYYRTYKTCQINDYEKTPITLREVGFPCINTIKGISFNILMPLQVGNLLEKNGFIVVGITALQERVDTFIIAAQKKGDINCHGSCKT